MKTPYTDHLIEIIESHPGIAEAELAELADCDPVIIEGALRDAIHDGDVIMRESLVSKHLKVYRYFIKSQIEMVPIMVLPPPAPPAPAPKQRKGSKGIRRGRNSKTSIARDCVQYIRAHGRVNHADLSKVIGSRSPQHPSSILQHSRMLGIVKLEDGFWTVTTQEEPCTNLPKQS